MTSDDLRGDPDLDSALRDLIGSLDQARVDAILAGLPARHAPGRSTQGLRLVGAEADLEIDELDELDGDWTPEVRSDQRHPGSSGRARWVLPFAAAAAVLVLVVLASGAFAHRSANDDLIASRTIGSEGSAGRTTSSPMPSPTSPSTTAPPTTALPLTGPSLATGGAASTQPLPIPQTTRPPLPPAAVPPRTAPQTTAPPRTTPSTTAAPSDVGWMPIQARALDLLNERRSDAGLVALQPDTRLMVGAQAWAERIASQHQISHGSFAVPGCRQNLENLGFGTSVESILESMMTSPGHRSNILSASANRAGVGVAAASDGTVYLVQRFGTC